MNMRRMSFLKPMDELNRQRKFSGFTLVELLVVISVIGLLASVILVSLNSARTKARDSRRKADLAQITKALELYYDTYGGYPTSAWNDGGAVNYTVFSSLCNQVNFAQLMPFCPHDPQKPNNSCYNAEYVYVSESFRDPANLGKKYVLYATLEDQSTTNLDPAFWPDSDETGVWIVGCESYGTPNYRLGDLKQ